MNRLILFLALIVSLPLSSQTNNVHNGDFETTTGTIDCSYFPNAGISSHNQDHLEEYWDQDPPWTVPERSFGLVTVATSDHICPDGNFGPIYGQIANREYICQEMVSTLEAGKTYYIEFYIRKPVGGTLDNAGIKFSLSRPKQWGYHKLNIDNGSPDIEIDNAISFPANVWTKYATYYTPSSNSNWLTVGTFGKDVDFSQLFHIDDIKIIEWTPICPTIQLLENWDYTGFQGILISAADYLYAGYDVGAPRANGNIIVQTGSEISYKAGQEVGLFDGFVAANGCEFHAYNAPCGSDCFPPSPSAGIATDFCDGSSYQIGQPPGFNETYSWSASPASGLGYLSSTTISNPVFTPPSSGSGTIIYTLAVTNSCGQTGTNSVSIHFESSPSNTAALSLSNISFGDIPTFDVNYDSHVKSITVEVLDASLTNVYYAETFFDVLDFTCCSFPWELPVGLSPCMDYKIRVTATNYCTMATTTQILDWIRNRNVALTSSLPNIITHNGDGIDDQFCFQFTGAASYTLIVNSPSGVPVFTETNTAYPTGVCSWAGECNTGLPACSGDHVGDGVYFYTLTLFGCDNQPAYSTAGFVELLNGSGRHGNDSVSAQTEKSNGNQEILLFPNPADNSVMIKNISLGSAIKLINSQGQALFEGISEKSEIELNLQDVPAGIYLIEITNNDMRIIRKLVVY